MVHFSIVKTVENKRYITLSDVQNCKKIMCITTEILIQIQYLDKDMKTALKSIEYIGCGGGGTKYLITTLIFLGP